ncbi:MAG TPA: hypothetical protein PKA63_12040 [Oligoflexia bacterium]|nr:hypothetical protein [Oligoflexia bacterium]HMP49385.1 hypothetical protein [Oligoflexia bacterium]
MKLEVLNISGNRSLCLVLLSCLSFIFTSSCSPVQGYIGPELPKTEIATVYYTNCDGNLVLVRAASEGVSFTSSGITLLPGDRVFDLSVELPGRPFDCIPQTKIDEYGYQECMRRRAEAERKGDRYVPICLLSTYTETVYWCQQTFTQFICTTTQKLEKGMDYNICAYSRSNEVFTRFMSQKGGTTLTNLPCESTSVDTRRVERSSAW